MSEQKFKKGQLIIAKRKVEGNTYSWNVYQYMGENHEKVFVLGGFLTKEHYQFACYEGNEELLGTYGDPAPKWKPKEGELVAVTDSLEETWRARRFFARNETLFLCYREKGAEVEGWLFCEPLRKHFNVPEA